MNEGQPLVGRFQSDTKENGPAAWLETALCCCCVVVVLLLLMLCTSKTCSVLFAVLLSLWTSTSCVHHQLHSVVVVFVEPVVLHKGIDHLLHVVLLHSFQCCKLCCQLCCCCVAVVLTVVLLSCSDNVC